MLQVEGRVGGRAGAGLGQGDGDTGGFPCEVEDPEAAGDSWQTTVLLARQPGVEVAWLEEARGGWKAMLLAALSKLSMLLALRSGGAAGIWRHWLRERRRRRSDVIRGGKGGTVVQRWWM